MKSIRVLAVSCLAVVGTQASALPDGEIRPTEREVRANSIGMQFVPVAGGRFRMGSPPSEEGRRDDEAQVEVTLTKPFFLATTEVTQKQWRSVMRTRPWKGERYVKEGDDYPAVCVSWEDAREFCRKLGELEGTTYRLPTEAEWEFACRAGTTTPFSFGDDESQLGDHAWYGGLLGEGSAKSGRYPRVVATRQPNSLGLYDMHGNVYEWCADWYAHYPDSPVINPHGPSDGTHRVHRGGAWNDPPVPCRSAARGGSEPTTRVADVGFRVASTDRPPQAVAAGSDTTKSKTPAAESSDKSTLSWQLKPGANYGWKFDQEVKLRAPQRGQVVEANIRQVLYLDVHVAASMQGIATLNVSTTRIQAEMSLPGTEIKYDSETRDARNPEPDGDDAQEDPDSEKLGREALAALLAPVRELKFSVDVDRQCAVQSVRMDDDQRQAFQSLRPLQSFTTLFDEEGFSSAYLGGFVRLPAGKFPGAEPWVSRVVSPNASPLLGELEFEHEFRSDGAATLAGERLQKFSAAVRISSKGARSELIQLGKQSGEGVLYFDAKQGRVHSSQWNVTAQLRLGGGEAEGELKIRTVSEIRDAEIDKAD